MKPGDELAQCFPNCVALSAHFPRECNGKDANTLPLLAQNTQNPARFLAETWQGLVSKDIQQNERRKHSPKHLNHTSKKEDLMKQILSYTFLRKVPQIPLWRIAARAHLRKTTAQTS